MTTTLETPVTAAQLRAAIDTINAAGRDVVGNVSAAMLKRMETAADYLEAQPPHPLDTATEYLTDRGACPECSHPVHTANGPDRGWIHTETGQYTCPPGTAGSMAGPAVNKDQLSAKYDEGHADGAKHQEDIDNETMYTEDELSEKVADAEELGTKQGRTQMRQELEDALFAAISEVGDDATADELRNALADAWNETEA